jgi:hypothetical protein
MKEAWKRELKGRIIAACVTDPSAIDSQELLNAQVSMKFAAGYANRYFNVFFNNEYRSLSYNYLATLYQSLEECKNDTYFNSNGREIISRVMFVMKWIHCEHLTSILFTDQFEYIKNRRTALAMCHHKQLGAGSLLNMLKEDQLQLILKLSFNEDPFLSNVGNESAILLKWTTFYEESH